MKKLFLLLLLLLPLSLNAQTTNPPGVLAPGSYTGTSSNPPTFSVVGISSPSIVAMYSGTNTNPNGVIAAGIGSVYNQYQPGLTNFIQQWSKGAPSGSTSNWTVISASTNITQLNNIATAAAQGVVNLNSTNILYVSANGSAANNGTFSSPFGLLSQAISNQFTGCIIRVSAGTYVDQITSEQLLYTNVCIDASPGAIIIITNEISTGVPAVICGSLSNTISGGQWFMYMTNYTVSQWNTWCLFGNAAVNPTQFIIQHLRVTTPAAVARFSVPVVATVNDCNLNAGYCGVVCVDGSGTTLINVMNTIISVTNMLPAGASLAADWRTAYRLKGSNSGQMIIQNCAAFVSDQGMTSGNTNAYAIGQQVGGGTNQFIINGLSIDRSQCTNAASYHVGVLGTGASGGSFLFNNVYDVNGAALTYTNLFSGNPKPWRSSPSD